MVDKKVLCFYKNRSMGHHYPFFFSEKKYLIVSEKDSEYLSLNINTVSCLLSLFIYIFKEKSVNTLLSSLTPFVVTA